MKPSSKETKSSNNDGIPIQGDRPPGQPPSSGAPPGSDTGPHQPERQLPPEAVELIKQQTFWRARRWPDAIADVIAEASGRCLQDPDYQLIQNFRQENCGT